jgi:Transposase DDE domain/Domain of unknown function (DUF4372)
VHQGLFVFSQLMQQLPWHTFRRVVRKYDGNRYVKRFSCSDQFLCMAFAQLTARESLRDIEVSLGAHRSKCYHLGLRSDVCRSTLADANDSRDWRIFAEFAQALIAKARCLYAGDSLGDELKQVSYALDSTTIEVSLNLFPWAPAMHEGCGGIKLHTLLDLRGALPTVVAFSPSRQHDVHFLDQVPIEPGAFYVMDRGYLDFQRLHRLHQGGAHFLMRAKRNLRVRRRCSLPVDDRTLTVCDQIVVLSRDVARADYPLPLRRLRLRDSQSNKSIVLLTNQFQMPAASIGTLYRQRWQIETFFKWIKQHLRIKRFYGRSPNAVKTQVWIALTIYVLVAILKKRLGSNASLHELLQVLSVMQFEKTPINTVFSDAATQLSPKRSANQLNLFEY